MSVSIFEHPVYRSLFSDKEFTEPFTAEADIKAMLLFEAELAIALGECQIIPEEAARRVNEVCCSFSPDIARLSSAAARDGVVVPDLVKQLKEAVGEEYAQYVHIGATSQDVIDTSLILRLVFLLPKVKFRIKTVLSKLNNLEEQYGSQKIMAHTRMQQALPIRVSDKIQSWERMLLEVQEEIEIIKFGLQKLQFAGPVGTLHSLGDNGIVVTKLLGKSLGLSTDDTSWHTNRLSLTKFTDCLSRLTGALGKIGIDIALLSQNEVRAVTLEQGGGSSSMPHKNNPVQAEILVTLAKFVAAQTGAMHQSLIHENERSGSSWSLEWMVLPQIVVATGAALSNAISLLERIQFHELKTGSED